VLAALSKGMASVMTQTTTAPANTMVEIAVVKKVRLSTSIAKNALAKILALLERTAKEHVQLAVPLRVMEYVMTPTITVDVSMTVATAAAKMEIQTRGCTALHASVSIQTSKDESSEIETD